MDTPTLGSDKEVGSEADRSQDADGEVLTAVADAVPPKGDSAAALTAGADASIMAVSTSQRVSGWSSWPTRAVGKLLFEDSAGNGYSCSAASIVSNTKNAIWTGGHCLHKGSGGSSGFYTNFLFLPTYRDGQTPWGWWFASRVIVPDTWGNDGDLEGSDMGALVVYNTEGYGNLQDEIGAYGYRFDGDTGFSNAYSYGYPSDGYNRPDSDFSNGEYMMYCNGDTVDADDWNPFDDRLRMTCDMGHGASGGPMVIGVDDNNVQIIGANSRRNGDSNGNFTDNYLFSSNHESKAAAVINLVNSG